MAENRNGILAALLAQQYQQPQTGGVLNALATQPVTANRNMLAQALRARTKPEFQMQQNTPQGILDAAALATSPVPILGDLAGIGADAYRFATDPGSRNWLNYGLAALGALPMIPAMSMGLGKLAQSQGKTLGALPAGPGRNQAGAIVYHGSPHRFDAFDSSKIGTGEGAQAYGHGLYFAENQDVAKSYASANKGRAAAKDGWIDSLPQSKQMDVYSILQSSLPDFEKMARLESMKGRLGDDVYEAVKTKLTSNNLYKVDLPDEAIAKMIDYDAPLSKQPEAVKKALPEYANLDWPVTRLQGRIRMASGQLADTEAQLSQALRERGLLGIRYLDGGSRNQSQRWIARHLKGGEDVFNSEAELMAYIKRNPEYTAVKPNLTNNYVVFPGNEGLLKILERQ